MIRIEPRALLVDITRCIGCKACVAACMESHGIAGDPDAVRELSANALTALTEHGDLFVRQLCRHCLEPSCASACPVDALRKTERGPVVYDASRCMGCRYCMQACPFNVPKYQWSSAVPAVVKCDFCAARQEQGLQTACAEACPAEATVFGTRAALLAEAQRRLAENPAAYYPQIYGAEEVGGTSVLFLSPVPFSELGFPTNVGNQPLPALTAAALGRIPSIVSVGGALLFGVWWITQRRDEVARAEAAERTTPSPPHSVSSSANEEGPDARV
jgi:formate dehydrogenase iron-sulfur subunit